MAKKTGLKPGFFCLAISPVSVRAARGWCASGIARIDRSKWRPFIEEMHIGLWERD
jgi:hypothetical protein